MATILVVSQSSSLSLALATTEHDIVETTPDDAGDYEVDLYVVDLDEPLDAVVFLGDLGADDVPPPTVVVIGDSPEWHSVRSLETPGLAVVERPVSRSSLVAAVDDLLGGSPTGEGPTDPALTVPAQQAHALDDADATVDATAEPLGASTDSITVDPPAVEAGPADRTLHRVARMPRLTPPARPQRASSRSPGASEQTQPGAQPERHRGRRRAPDPLALASSGPPRSLAESADELVHTARRLQGLDIVACDAVGRAMAAVDGSAGALLLRDGDNWCTAGGLALRPREWMAQVATGSWLVDTVARQHQAVTIEDTDIARQRLAGVPLARYRNLVAVPLPAVHGVLLIAREDEAFDAQDLQALAGVARDSESDLSQALLLREVADALHRFAERRQL